MNNRDALNPYYGLGNYYTITMGPSREAHSESRRNSRRGSGERDELFGIAGAGPSRAAPSKAVPQRAERGLAPRSEA